MTCSALPLAGPLLPALHPGLAYAQGSVQATATPDTEIT